MKNKVSLYYLQPTYSYDHEYSHAYDIMLFQSNFTEIHHGMIAGYGRFWVWSKIR